MPNCPNCGTKMGKAGKHWSGRKQVQRWACAKCGRITVKQDGKK